jgi:hypothetical protein
MPPTTKPSPLSEAFHRLNETPAISICEDTAVPAPDTKFVVDRCLATYAARAKEGFAFIPDESIWQTYSMLRSANAAWEHDKLPVLAVCALSKSPAPMQRETGIQADTVDQFLSDLTLAHRIVPKLGDSPAYIVRHYPRPHEIHDEVILPAHTNLIVYQPHALSDTQLTKLFEHVASVHGKVILCDDREAFANSHPELTPAVERSLSKAIPRSLRKNIEPPERTPTEVKAQINMDEPAPSLNQPGLNGDSHAPGNQQPLHFGPRPAETPYLIYHAKTTNPAEFPSGYRLVAKVTAKSLPCALANSQDFGAPWTENPGVVTFTDKKPRSTRPGDVIVQDGIAQRFDGNGFKQIEIATKPQPRPSHDRAPSIDAPSLEAPAPKPPRMKIAL